MEGGVGAGGAGGEDARQSPQVVGKKKGRGLLWSIYIMFILIDHSKHGNVFDNSFLDPNISCTGHFPAICN